MEWLVDEPDRLDLFLVARLGSDSRSRVAKHIAAGFVRVNGEVCQKPGMKLKRGQTVESEAFERTPPHELIPADIPLNVVYEDEELLVVNKPRGLAVHPAATLSEPTLVEALLGRGTTLSQGSAEYRPGIVHRLDRQTTGLILVAKSDRMHVMLADAIQRREIDRRYVAVVSGMLPHSKFTVDAPLGKCPRNPMARAVLESGKRAVTHFKAISPSNRYTVLAARLETGRTHQIRVHAAHFGFPILGDPLYGRAEDADHPMHLHAAWLKFEHPTQQRQVVVYAPPPPDFLFSDLVRESDVEDW